MSRRFVRASALAGAIVCLAATPAAAHVSIDPPSAPQGSTVKLSFLVPNEEATATVNKVQIAFPIPPDTPIPGVSVGQKPGWKATVTTKHLAKAIETDNGSITDVVSEVDWVALTPANAIKPGEFGEFTIDADGLPADEDQVVFKAIQTYSNRQVVRWIDPVTAGGAEPAHPTPILELTAPDSGGGTTPTTSPVSTGDATSIVATTKDNSARALGIIGIALGAVALVGATGAFLRKRRAA
jgi:uncharacterized protein YcnI